MNYTGRPSISGCRPVLSLYPTHHFCQYLLGIFITFTNSSLFCRAFSTNSRRALSQRLSLWERSSTSPSRLTRCHCPGCGSQRLLRCRLHPAGRCPNSSSLFPPLAAVVAVAHFSRFSDLLLRSGCYLSADGNVQQKREIFGGAVNGRSTKKCV